MPDAHSKHSASGFEAAMLCPGKRVLEHGKPNTSSKYSAWGTVGHTLASEIHDGLLASVPIGTVIEQEGFEIVVDQEMANCVNTYLANVATIVAGGMSLAEQRVNYAHVLDVPATDAWGTADIIAACGARPSELQVHDLKTGMGVEVSAGEDVIALDTGEIIERKPNVQMALYGLGALEQAQGILGDFDTVRLVIHQPRIKDAPSEYLISVADLLAWGQTVAHRSADEQLGAEKMATNINFSRAAWEATYLRPGEKQCKFCRAKATCPALRAESLEPIFGSAPPSADEFDQVAVPSADHIKPATDDWLAAVMRKADLIEDWLKAVRAEVEKRLLQGQAVPGWKLVQGKRGNRAWRDAEIAEATLKGMRLKTEEMYDLKLISPTTAEKLAKPPKKEGDPQPLIGPRQWAKVQALITQSDGKPSVAPATDPRPALDFRPATDEFEPVNTAAEFA